MLITPDFLNAVSDYRFLLERRYSLKNILKIVADRYKLNSIQRSFLYRGITSKDLALKRKSKLITEKQTTGAIMHVDLYNVLLTVNSYLKGKPVFIACDGYLRDAGELKGKISQNSSFDRPVDLILSFLSTIDLNEVIFYIDSPVQCSKELENLLKSLFIQYKLNGKIERIKEVDKLLCQQKEGVIVTSDTEIIDKTILKMFDLAKNVLKYHFNAHFVNLQNTTNLKGYSI